MTVLFTMMLAMLLIACGDKDEDTAVTEEVTETTQEETQEEDTAEDADTGEQESEEVE